MDSQREEELRQYYEDEAQMAALRRSGGGRCSLVVSLFLFLTATSALTLALRMGAWS